MQSISNTIYATYTARLGELSPQKRFHFANRLYSWTGDPQAAAILQSYAPDPSETDKILTELLARRADNDPSINLLDLRAPYFSRYPWLYGLELALFQMRHWYIEYKLDTRSFFRSNAHYTLWDTGLQQLRADIDACAALSSYAVNALYLWHRLIQEDEQIIFAPDETGYLHSNDVLALYFATHCCLGETLFYARAVPADKLALQRLQLSSMEARASEHLASLPIDALLETVVTQRLCDIESSLQLAVLARAESHFDGSLGYITDPAKPDKNDLNGAEHRNVLYLMATMPSRESLRP